MEIAYRVIDGVPLKFFDCSKLSAMLSVGSCADNFRKARVVKNREFSGLIKCVNCPIGAMHAGVELVMEVKAMRSMECTRCHQESNRIVCGGICTSCHARQKEVERGVNAKGTPPRPVERWWGWDLPPGKTVFTHPASASMMSDNGVEEVYLGAVADSLELMLRCSRGSKTPVSFSRPSLLDTLSRSSGDGIKMMTLSHYQRARAMMSGVPTFPLQYSLFPDLSFGVVRRV